MSASNGRPCPACLSGEGRIAGEVRGFPLRGCGRCKTIYATRLPAAMEAKDYESYFRPGRPKVPEFVLTRLEQTVARFDRYRGAGTWLDVGCGAGTLMRAAASSGWQVVGTEVASRAVEALREAGLDARLGELGDLDFEAGSFDVVSMVEVIEHVPEPDALLHDAARLVRGGGALYLTTPNGRGLSGRLLGAGWTVVSPPEHMQLYSVQGMRTALIRAGLVPRSIQTHAVNPYELRAALRRRPGRDGGTSSPRETGYQLNESLSSSRKGAFLKATANLALNATRLGDTLKVVAERRS